MNMFAKICKGIAIPLFKVLFPYQVVNKNCLPETGKFIVCSNHISMKDPIFIGMTQNRLPNFMAKEELFEGKIFGKLLPAVGTFPVSRGESDMASLRTAMACLKNGEILGIFPEGKRGNGAGLLPFKKGVALIAYKSKVPVIPIGMKRSRNFFYFWNRPRPSLVVGEPLQMPAQKSADMLEEYTEKFQHTVASLIARQDQG